MKKFLKVICVIFVLGACFAAVYNIKETKKDDSSSSESVSDADSNSDGKSENSSNDENKSKKYSVGDTATINDFEITVDSIEVTDKIDSGNYTYFSPKDEGSKYLVVNATVKNIASESQEFLPVVITNNDVSVKIQYNDYEFNSSNLLGFSDDLHMTSLNPLSSKTGVIAFEIADEALESIDEFELVFSSGKEKYSFALEQ